MAERQPEQLPTLGLGDVLMQQAEEETELDKVVKMFLDPANIGHLTEMNSREITAFSVVGTMASRHDLPVLTAFLAENKVLRVSKGRKGRGEFAKMISRQLAVEDGREMEGRFGGLRRAFRRRQP